MNRRKSTTIASLSFALVLVLSGMEQVQAQDAKTPYPRMAPLDQYLMDHNAEIALARSAAPASISRDARVVVLGPHGYETAVEGKNGFACIVERSWTAGIDDPDFWNPKLRAPMCLNPSATRSYLPLTIKKTELVLAGQSKAQMFDSIKAAFEKKELPMPESGTMCYMMSKQQYKVIVTNATTKTTRDTISDAKGNFQVLSVPVGTGVDAQDTDKEKVVKAYYAGFEQHDWNAVANQFADGFTFTSPNDDDHISVEKFKEKCWGTNKFFKKVRFIKMMEKGDELMLLVDITTTDNKVARNVDVYSFSSTGKIKSIEVFFGAGSKYPGSKE
jgi:hypothetical protein